MNPNLSDGAKKFLEAGARAGGMVSDGPVSDGWGVLPFMGERAHHWTAGAPSRWSGATPIRSACGIEDFTVPSVPLLGVGSFSLCKRCEAKLLKEMKQ